MPDGTVEGTYVHYDGYPDHMVPQVCWFLEERTPSCLLLEIKRAQSVGGFIIFHPIATGPADKVALELRDSDEEERFNADDFGEGVPYTYLVDFESGKVEARERIYIHADAPMWKRIPIAPKMPR
jgi:hypothetical protein